MAEEKKEKFKYDPFSYDAYQESDTVKQAQAALQAQIGKKPGAYQSQWQAQLDDVMSKIQGRQPFSYDLNGDALYQQYKDRFQQQGRLAMQDTMGQAAAMTGGYGNSYAQSVGQQAYQANLAQLNDVIPELYQMAYDRYAQEGQDLYSQYGMISDRESQDYGRYRDSVGDWQTEREYLAGRYDSERDYDYGIYDSERDHAYAQYGDDRTLAYETHRDKIADAQWQAEFDEAKRRWDAQYGDTYSGDNTTTSLAPASGDNTTTSLAPASNSGKGKVAAQNNITEAINDDTPKAKEDGDYEADLNAIIAADNLSDSKKRSLVNQYLRSLVQAGSIDTATYKRLKETFAPRGSTY